MKQTFKEYLRPKNGYTEGPMSLVTHNGILYKLDCMFELSADLPVTMIPMADLRWQVENMQADEARVKKADINVPIIVTPQNGQYIILDGTHRVLKALKSGEKTVPARVIFHDILGMTRLGSGPDVAFASNVDDLNPYLGEGVKDELNQVAEFLESQGFKISKRDKNSVTGSKPRRRDVRIAKNDEPGEGWRMTVRVGGKFANDGDALRDGEERWLGVFSEKKLDAFISAAKKDWKKYL